MLKKLASLFIVTLIALQAHSKSKDDFVYHIVAPSAEMVITVPLVMVPPPYKGEPAKKYQILRLEDLPDALKADGFRRLVVLNYYIDGVLLRYATLHVGVAAYAFDEKYPGSLNAFDSASFSQYVKWLTDTREPKYRYSISEAELAGRPAVKRSFLPLSKHPVFPNDEKRMEIHEYNVPIDPHAYITLSFTVTEERPNSEKSWRKEMNAVIDGIRSKIVIIGGPMEPKPL
jgi:hypothetical protein